MRSYLVLVLLLSSLSLLDLFLDNNSDGTGIAVSIGVETPIPGYKCYKGYNFTLEVTISNGFGESVDISIETLFEPFETMWTNYSQLELEPGGDITYAWILRVPRNISYGNYTLGLNMTYTVNSTTYNMYREAWVQVIPRNISLLVADLKHNATGYYLVVSNPITDPGQYIVENITVTITAYNVSAIPHKIFVKKLYANSSYTIPLSISFNKSDIGALTVNATTYDDVHGLVYFNYTFIVVNASAYLHLCLVDDYGNTLPEALVVIDNVTYSTEPGGCLNLVLPIGFHNYTILYQGHRVSGKLMLHTGYNNYTLTIDLNPPTIVSVGQKGFGVYIKAFDPGERSTGVSSIVFIQDGNEWRYTFYPRRNVSFILYPPLASGETTIVGADMQGNNAATTIQYVKPGIGYNAWETILVLAITSTVLVALLIITRSSE